VRFCVAADDSAAVVLSYAVERDHLPLSHGPLRWSRERRAFEDNGLTVPFGAQARAYVASYLRRKRESEPR
jgi:hypothetical protein